MDKVREERESGIERKKLKAFQDKEAARERPSWLPYDWKAELRIGSDGGNLYTIYENMFSGFKTHSKQEVLQYQNTMESEVSLGNIEETGIDYISYDYDMDQKDWSENEYGARENVENFSNIISTSLRSLPGKMQKLESRAKTRCVFEDEDMSSDSDKKLPECEASKEEGCNLHDVVVECADKGREIPGLTGSFSIEINLECEPVSDSLVEKELDKSGSEGIGTRNIEIRDQDSDLMHISASSKVDKSEEPLKAQATQEETANESRRSVFFPCRESPSQSVLVFDNSNADDLINTIELGLNPQEKNICVSKKQKRNSYKNTQKKDTEAQTKRIGKRKTPPSSSVVMEKTKRIDWPEPCPNFPFEPLTSSFGIEDDSVIRRYLEESLTAAGSADSNLPLPDFGLPSFSNIKISLNE